MAVSRECGWPGYTEKEADEPVTPDQFLAQIKSGKVAPAYLFLGPDAWRRDRCRKALLEAWFANAEEMEQGFTRLDLEETSLRDAVDDAMAMSLFATRRVIWVTSAEIALPRGRAAAKEEESEEGGSGEKSPSALETYLKNPSPDVVLILQCSRYSFDGDDKAKLERVSKYYGVITNQVEFPHPTNEEAFRLAQSLAKAAGISFAGEALDLLLEAVGNNATRLATEIEKLALLAKGGAAGEGRVTLEMVQNMVPDARQTTIFALVAAMGRRDRVGSLELLDTLVREGEYLPLSLSFLAGQFRLALTAKEARLSGSFPIQQHFQRMGVPMWKSKADQIAQTAQAFSVGQLRSAMQQLFQADRGLRDIRVDDRTVMERLILHLTA